MVPGAEHADSEDGNGTKIEIQQWTSMLYQGLGPLAAESPHHTSWHCAASAFVYALLCHNLVEASPSPIRPVPRASS